MAGFRNGTGLVMIAILTITSLCTGFCASGFFNNLPLPIHMGMNRLNKGSCLDFCCGGSRDIIGYAISIQIPAHECVSISLGIGRRFKDGSADDFCIALWLYGNHFTRSVAEAYPTPLVSVNYAVSVAPVREIIIPAQFLFQSLNKNCNVRQATKKVWIPIQLRQVYRVQNYNIL